MRQRDENKMQAIREKAIEIIAIEGLENFGINKLAKAVGVSPATIYIYYKDKDDLISQLSVEEGLRMCDATLEGFDGNMDLEEGLWIQWKNRSRYAMNNRLGASFFDQLRNSNYRDKMLHAISEEMRKRAGGFLENLIKRGEVNKMSVEMFWAVAFSPLYTLVKFHEDGRSFGDRKFIFSQEMMREAFFYVIKALKK
jgi:AcrR family transcriptional regulator